MKIYLISADGYGAGKSTLATKLAQETWSLAGALRARCQTLYPGYDWYSKSGAYKQTLVPEAGYGKTVRDVLIQVGQDACKDEPAYWANLLAMKLAYARQPAAGIWTIAIDDLRKVCELELLKSRFGDKVTHFHITHPNATPEPQYENEQLKERADYVLTWKS